MNILIILKKSFLFFILSLFIGNYAWASSIPSFCLFGWINQSCKSINSITEWEYYGSPLKKYTLSGSTITEWEYYGGPLKRYTLSGSTITEWEYYGSPLKKYTLSGSTIIECEYYGNPLKKYTLN